MIWPGDVVDPKNLFLFENHSLDIKLSFYIRKYEEKAKNVNFQPFQTEKFSLKKSTISGTFHLQLQRNFSWEIQTCNFITN
jgi:hypothetical protein